MLDFLSTYSVLSQYGSLAPPRAYAISPSPHFTFGSFIQDNFKPQETTMTRSTIRNPLHLSLLAATLILQLTHAQVGTITEDIYTLSAFSLQKPCAQSCFVITGVCPNDVLGSVIGCKTETDCFGSNWPATNDCYCRTDLQQPARDYLTSCIENGCNVGNSKIDASSAGSIYAQYCAEKGYSTATGPATVQATTTESGASTTTGSGASTTNASPTSGSQGSSSGSGKLSTTTIISIAVGGVVGLTLLVLMVMRVFKRSGRTVPPPTIPQPPIYPDDFYSRLYSGPYSGPKAESEVTPDDSVSMVSGMPRPAPTLVSNVQSHPPRRY